MEWGPAICFEQALQTIQIQAKIYKPMYKHIYYYVEDLNLCYCPMFFTEGECNEPQVVSLSLNSDF